MAYDKPLKIQWTEIDGRTVPLVLPQYWSDEQDDWVVSSEQNRLPVDAQLTGRNVEEIYLYDALAITDTSDYRVSDIDTSKYKKITILAESTLDQNVELLFYAGFDNTQSRFYDKETDSWVITYDKSITLTADNSYRYILNTKWDFLNEVNFKTISMRARCGTAPTSGSLTVKLIGVLN